MSEREFPIQSKDVTIRTTDGVELAASVFRAIEQTSTNVAIVACGVGLLRSRYRQYAQFLAENGWTVITFDYRGVGDSHLDDAAHRSSRLRDWGEQDLAACINWASELEGSQRIVVVGHSVGGQIFPFARNHEKVDRLITVCSQKGYWGYWHGVRKVALLTLWHILPVLVNIFGYLPLRLLGRGANIPSGIAREWGRWGRFEAFVDEHGQSLNSVFANVSSKILAISFADDNFYAPRRAVEALVDVYCNADVKHWHLEPDSLGCQAIGHTGFFHPNTGTLPLWESVQNWLDSDVD